VDTVIFETITQLINSAPMTFTTSAGVAVSTATAASNGVGVGDLTFIITLSVKSELATLFTGAQ
jgi:hypothetical protein